MSNARFLLPRRGLKHLRHLKLDLRQLSLTKYPGSVEVLQQLTTLQSLDLEYGDVAQAAGDAHLWATLPRLAALRILDKGAMFSRSQAAAQEHQRIMVRLPALTGLTRLELTLIRRSADSRVQVCSKLIGLTRLKQLHLECASITPPTSDCASLVSLRGLTSLTLHDLGEAVDVTAAVALACSMPELRDLDLTKGGILYDAPMPALAQLQHLTRLVLTGNSAVERGCVARLLHFRRAARLPEFIVLR